MILTTEEEKALTVWLPAFLAMVASGPEAELAALRRLRRRLAGRMQARTDVEAVVALTMGREVP